MQENQSVTEMATEVLARQAGARAERSGGSLEEALKGVLQTQDGQLLGELREEGHRNERAEQWQSNLQRKRAEERRQVRLEERGRRREGQRSRARKLAWSN